MRKRATTLFLFVLFTAVVSANKENYQSNIETDEVNIYPIPAKKHFTVEVPEQYLGGKIIINSVVGQEIKIINIEEEQKVKILTDDFPKGIYFISIQLNTKVVFTKRIVIEK